MLITTSPTTVVSVIVLVVIAVIIALFPTYDIKDGWKILHGKVCHKIPEKAEKEPTKAREEYESD